jgi:hypothetical protein
MKVDETPVEPEVDPPTLVTGHTGTLPYQTILSLSGDQRPSRNGRASTRIVCKARSGPRTGGVRSKFSSKLI